MINTILQATQVEFGENHPAHLSAKSNQALLYKTLGDYEQAIDIY
jgi:hypothetical protein